MLVTLTIIFTKPALADVDYNITNVDVTAPCKCKWIIVDGEKNHL